MDGERSSGQATGVLQGIRVIELGVWWVAPIATMLLAELGAEVIKIEQPGLGDGIRGVTHTLGGVPVMLKGGLQASFEAGNHSKLGMVLNLRSQEGKEILYRLVKESDVLVTNLNPKSTSQLGIDYEVLRKHNPRLIFALSTALGERGPLAGSGGYDLMVQAASGIMTTSGEYDMPPVQNAEGMADETGAIWLAFAVLAALLGRERLGIGQQVTTSQLGGLVALQRYIVNVALQVTGEFKRTNRSDRVNPLYNWYRCKDDQWIILGMMQPDKYWRGFCKAIGKPELESDPRFFDVAKRRENCKTLTTILDQVFATRTRPEWTSILGQTEVIFSPLNSIKDVINHPQVLENEYITTFDHPTLGRIRFPGNPIHFSETPTEIRSAAPAFGEHTAEVLTRICGYSMEEVAGFAERGAI